VPGNRVPGPKDSETRTRFYFDNLASVDDTDSVPNALEPGGRNSESATHRGERMGRS
jgi:hypothetical protein